MICMKNLEKKIYYLFWVSIKFIPFFCGDQRMCTWNFLFPPLILCSLCLSCFWCPNWNSIVPKLKFGGPQIEMIGARRYFIHSKMTRWATQPHITRILNWLILMNFLILNLWKPPLIQPPSQRWPHHPSIHPSHSDMTSTDTYFHTVVSIFIDPIKNHFAKKESKFIFFIYFLIFRKKNRLQFHVFKILNGVEIWKKRKIMEKK